MSSFSEGAGNPTIVNSFSKQSRKKTQFGFGRFSPLSTRLVESLFRINNENYESVLTDVLEMLNSNNYAYFPYIFHAASYAIITRPKTYKIIAHLLQVLSSLTIAPEKSYISLASRLIKGEKLPLIENSELAPIIKKDDVTKFTKLSDSPNFEFDKKLSTNDSMIFFVQNKASVTLAQLFAFFNCPKCLKYLSLSSHFNKEDLEQYIIAGGNKDLFNTFIIKEGYNFTDEDLAVAIKYHHYDIANIIIEKMDNAQVNLETCIKYYAECALYNYIDKVKQKNLLLPVAIETGNLPFCQYLNKKKELAGAPSCFINLAIEEEQFPIVEYFHKLSLFRIDEKDRYGLYPLDYTVKNQSLKIFSYLYTHNHKRITDTLIASVLNRAHELGSESIMLYIFSKSYPQARKSDYNYSFKKAFHDFLAQNVCTVSPDNAVVNTVDEEEEIIDDHVGEFIDAEEESVTHENMELLGIESVLAEKKRETMVLVKDGEGEDSKERWMLTSVRRKTNLSAKTIDEKAVENLLCYLRAHDRLKNSKNLSKITEVPHSTLYRWWNKARQDANWFPYKVTYRGYAMTEKLEKAIMWHINENFLKKGLFFNDVMCRAIALAFWEQNPSEHLKTNFSASYSWIEHIKEKYNVSNRANHPKKRVKHTEEDYIRALELFTNIRNVIQGRGDGQELRYIINIDETCWKLFDGGKVTWGRTGEEHVEAKIDYNEKESVTVIAGVDAECNKLPLYAIRKGETEQAINNLSDSINKKIQIDVTKDGWVDADSFVRYLIWLRKHIDAIDVAEQKAPNHLIDLVLDIYPAHIHDKVIMTALELNIFIHTIPAGFTDSMQPLDRYVFGALKSMARHRWVMKSLFEEGFKKNWSSALDILYDCWSDLSSDPIKEGWKPYKEEGSLDFDSLFDRATDLRIEEPTIKLDMKKANVFMKKYMGFEDFENMKGTRLENSEEEEEVGDEDDEFNNEIKYCAFNVDRENASSFIKTLRPYIEHELKMMKCSAFSKINVPFKSIIDDFHIWTARKITFIHLLSTLPELHNCINFYLQGNEDKEDNDVKEIKTILDNYNKVSDSVDLSESSINLENNCIKDTLFELCKKIGYPIGLTAGKTHEIGIAISPNDDIKERLDSLINGSSDYKFNRFFFLFCPSDEEIVFPESFIYNEYCFYLKTVIADSQEIDCSYLYQRRAFRKTFYKMNNKSIKKISYKKMSEDFLNNIAVYVPFQYDYIIKPYLPTPIIKQCLKTKGNTKTMTPEIWTRTNIKNLKSHELHIGMKLHIKNKELTDTEDFIQLTKKKPTEWKSRYTPVKRKEKQQLIIKYNISEEKWRGKKFPTLWEMPQEPKIFLGSYAVLLKNDAKLSGINSVLQIIINIPMIRTLINQSTSKNFCILILKELISSYYFDTEVFYDMLQRKNPKSSLYDVENCLNSLISVISEDTALDDLIKKAMLNIYTENHESHTTLQIDIDAHKAFSPIQDLVEETTKNFEYFQYPRFFIIHINRLHKFKCETPIYKKIDIRIEFAEKLILKTKNDAKCYELYGVISQNGEVQENCNYVSYICNNKKWYEFNNDVGKEVERNVAVDENFPNQKGKRIRKAAVYIVYRIE